MFFSWFLDYGSISCHTGRNQRNYKGNPVQTLGFPWVRLRNQKGKKSQEISEKIARTNIYCFLLVVETQESTIYLVSEQLSFSVIYDLVALGQTSNRETVTGALPREWSLHRRCGSSNGDLSVCKHGNRVLESCRGNAHYPTTVDRPMAPCQCVNLGIVPWSVAAGILITS